MTTDSTPTSIHDRLSLLAPLTLGVLTLMSACTSEEDTATIDEPTPIQQEPVASAEMTPETRIMLGSAAKRLCSSVFVSGRNREDVMAEELANPDLDAVEFLIETDTATARLDDRFVQALFRPRIGCTLINDRSVRELRAEYDSLRIAAHELANSDRDWPHGSRVSMPGNIPGMDLNEINSAVTRAFFDIEPEQDIRTRAVIIVHEGRIIAERYAPGWYPDIPQLGWSMAKTVTAALTAQLEQDGLLDIQAPAPVPEWEAPDDPRGAITTHQLLQMNSGLDFSEVYTAGSMSDVIRMLYTTGNTGAFAAEQELAHPPGTHWSYASGTTNILSRMQRQLFDEWHDYLNYAHEQLFVPLGMQSAILEPDESGTYVGSSYMYATPRDWARFGLLYLQDGIWNGERLLPEGWVEYSTRPVESAARGNYGAQVWLNAGAPDNPQDRPFPQLPTDMVYLSGFEGQNILLFPEHDLMVLRMGLTTSGPRPVWELAEAVLAAMD